MIKTIATACILALGTTTAFAATEASKPPHAMSGKTSKAMNANARMHKKMKMHRANAAEPRTTSMDNNWFGFNDRSDMRGGNGMKSGNNDWFADRDANMAGKHARPVAARNNDMNNNWFGGPPDNNMGGKKHKMSKMDNNNTDWFAPRNGTMK